MPRTVLLGLSSFLVLLLALSACQILNSGSTPTDDLDELEAEIIALIGDASATSVNQCQVIAFGSKPCGGPWRYLVYSTTSTDVDRLQNLVERYNELDDKRNREQGLVSDCALVTAPTLTLDGGSCRAN